jgi:adenine/guanine phosphoribosyltransferase-like PRPP-binding protein
MNRHPREPKTPTTDDVQRDGAVPQVTRERLSAAISDLLEMQWINEEPGERCFDHDEARMARLVSFLDGHAGEKESNDVKDHLLECSRCRFIYARVRETVKPAPVVVSDRLGGCGEPIPDLLRDNLRSTGAVVFPDGKVARGAWEFGQLGSLDEGASEDIVAVVAERAWCKLRSLVPRTEVVLVCFSRPVHICGKRLARKMIESGVKNVHVVIADDYFTPKLWCDPEELRGQHVVVFVDVVHTGGLLNRLFTACREACPREVTGIAVIDQSTECVSKEPFYPLWTETPEIRVPFDADRHSRARFFDPASALSRPREDLPKEVADPTTARATVESHLAAIEPLKPYIEATSALRRDAKIASVHYPWVVDLLRLLGHDEARAELATRAADRLKDLQARGPWCLIYPAERSKRAGTWADLISTALRWPVVKVGLKTRTHYCQLTPKQRQELAKCPRALIIDAAIRTGKTLQSLVHLLRAELNPPVCEISAFYAFDGLFSEPREALEKNLGVEIRSLFRLPLGAPTEPVGRHCRQRMTDTLQELAELEAQGPSAWVDIVRGYCKKQLQKRRGRSKQRPHDYIER